MTPIGTIKFFTSKFDSISSSAQVCPGCKANTTDADLPAQFIPAPAPLRGSQIAIRGLTNVSRDEFRHLEHADLVLAVEYGPHRVVGVDLSSFCLVLWTVPLVVVPTL